MANKVIPGVAPGSKRPTLEARLFLLSAAGLLQPFADLRRWTVLPPFVIGRCSRLLAFMMLLFVFAISCLGSVHLSSDLKASDGAPLWPGARNLHPSESTFFLFGESYSIKGHHGRSYLLFISGSIRSPRFFPYLPSLPSPHGVWGISNAHAAWS